MLQPSTVSLHLKELNNGMPSGGFTADYSRQSMLINMLHDMQNSLSLSSLQHQLLALQSDYSLIVSSANGTDAISFEYSSNSTLWMKSFFPQSREVLVYTNFYLNETWGANRQTKRLGKG